MPIPTYDQFIDPLLRALVRHATPITAAAACEEVADAVDLSAEERMERLPSGGQPVYRNRIGWAHDRLKRSGYSSSPLRGRWLLTDKGRAFAHEHPAALSDEDVAGIAAVPKDHRLRDAIEETPSSSAPRPSLGALVPSHASAVVAETRSPDERIESALEELTESVTAELLEMILRASPTFFENLVLDLLHTMGYGTSRRDLQRVGGSGDGGIDGIISLDRLGLEKVYVQAKRWQGNVGRPELQGFFGALAGRRANKGVFITTSRFTREAEDFARSVSDTIVLVDGDKLTGLMVEHGVAVSHKALRIPEIDSDYFDAD